MPNDSQHHEDPAHPTGENASAHNERDRIVAEYMGEASTRARNVSFEEREKAREYEVRAQKFQRRQDRRVKLMEDSARGARKDEELEREGSKTKFSRPVRHTVAGDPQVTYREAGKRYRRALNPKAPYSTAERHRYTHATYEKFEKARGERDVLASRPLPTLRQGNRTLIDGRGSIDSRAFDESGELVGYSIDAGDRHNIEAKTYESNASWSSSDGKDGRGKTFPRIGKRSNRQNRRLNLTMLSDTISGSDAYAPQPDIRGYILDLPIFVKIAVPIILILVIILLVILFG